MGWCEYARYAAMAAEELARDCEVQVFRATGPGGQGVNTTDSAVRMKHVHRDYRDGAREPQPVPKSRELPAQAARRARATRTSTASTCKDQGAPALSSAQTQ